MNKELPASVVGTPLRLARYFFLAQVLLREEINIPIAQLVSIWLEYVSLSDELAGELAAIHAPEFDRVMTGPSGAPDMAAVAGFTLTPHLTDRRTLAELMDACEPLSAAEVRRLLWFVGGQESTAQFVFDRAWLAEFKNAAPD